MDTRPTLLVQTTYFHDGDREAALALGKRLYDWLTRPGDQPLAFGARIPVLAATHPHLVDPSAARHTVILPVLGNAAFQDSQRRMAARDTIGRWDTMAGAGHVLPVLASPAWDREADRLPKNPIRGAPGGGGDDEELGRLLVILVALCRVLSGGTGPTVFISHAKADLLDTKQLAEQLRDFIRARTHAKAFFDTTDLRPGDDLARMLEAAAGEGVFLAVRGDRYGSRPWVERELLDAKRAKVPTLTLYALRQGERRSYPYAGNGPTMVWEPGAGPAPVVLRLFVEWLRARHFELEASRITAGLPPPVVMPRPPELLDLAQGPLLDRGSVLVLHPDPELSAAERQVLREARPRMRLLTPSTLYRGLLARHPAPGGGAGSLPLTAAELASRGAPLFGREVALSVSESTDGAAAQAGLLPDHVKDGAVFLARCLVSAGAAIAYGGDLRAGGYDELFVDLIDAYNLSGNANAEYLVHYQRRSLPPRDDIPLTTPVFEERDIALPPVPADLSPGRAALYVSEMRRFMTRRGFGRVLLGGQTAPRPDGGGAGYGGPYPGVVEEAWWSLHEGKPLYVIGGLGGAGRLVAELLEGKATPRELRAETFAGPDYDGFRARADEIRQDDGCALLARGFPRDMEAVAEALRERGRALLASDRDSLDWNGLTVRENRELFHATDAVTIAQLVMKGLLHCAAREARGKLHVTLVRGSITQVEGADALAVATFSDVPMGGAGAALDQRLSSRVTKALQAGETLVQIPTDEVDADWLVLVDLGKTGDLSGLPAAVQEAARSVAASAMRHRFGTVGVVTFGGNVLEDQGALAERMVEGLRAAASGTTVQWFERDPDKFEVLARTLKARDDVQFEMRKLSTEVPIPGTPPDRDLFITVHYEGERIRATLLAPRGAAHAVPVSRLLPRDQFEKIARADATETPSESALAEIGDAVAGAVFGEDGAALLARYKDHRLVVQHDAESARLPFETLRVGGHAFALGEGVVRRPEIEGVRLGNLIATAPHVGRVNLLLVANPTEDLKGTEDEARAVQVALEGSSSVRVAKVLLRGDATKAAVLEALQKEDVDVLHFGGHAFFASPGEGGSGIVCAKREILGFEDLRSLASVPRVVFFNACQSARVRGASLPLDSRGFAEFFLRAGVEAYLGTFWPVKDAAAARFAVSVYRELAAGKSLDESVQAGRRALKENKESDWADYVLYGAGAFRIVL